MSETDRDRAVELLITVKARLQEMLQNKNPVAAAAERLEAAQ